MDVARDLPLLIALAALIVLAILLGAAEASLLRVSRVRVEVRAERGSLRAQRLLSLIHDLPRVLNSVLLAVLLVQIGAATVTGVLAERWFGNVGVTLGSVVLTLVLFVYAEAIPKTYAVRHPSTVAMNLSLLLWTIFRLSRPVVTVLVKFADLQAPGRGIASSALDEEELLRLAEESEAAGVIDSSDRELMEAGFRLGDRKVDEILVPRIDIVAVSEDATVDHALEEAVAAGHRRLPVYEGDLDHITGMVRLRELAAAVGRGEPARVADLSHPVLAVPETKQVLDLLREMQKAGLHLAVVVDEHGGTAGIVTIEDVVEDLVGDVADEGEREEPLIRATGDGAWMVAGGCPVEHLEEELRVELPEGDWHTVAGMMLGVSGRILGRGEEVEVAGLRFRVASASANRILDVEVERT